MFIVEDKFHLKGLNGLRAIAALSVVLSHIRMALPEFPSIITRRFDIADCGVTIFFTLSGFLITFLLHAEWQTGRLSIRNFYMRRILRIWPLYFTYLVIALLTIYIYSPEKLPGSLPYYLLFAANITTIFRNPLPHLFHYWTLGVEEQFYIFWPLLIKFSKKPLKAILTFTVCFFVAKLVCRFIYFQWNNILPLRVLTVNRFECMSMGGIAAILCIQGNSLFLKIAGSRICELLCWASLVLMGFNGFHVSPFVDNDLVTLITIGLIVNLAYKPQPIINLDNVVFEWLGRISFGIYIVHPLVIYFYAEWLKQFQLTPVMKITATYIGILTLTIFFAWLSYELLEKRFLRLKRKYTTARTFALQHVIKNP